MNKEQGDRNETERQCFVIMPISDQDGYESGHFQRVLDHLIRPAVMQAGFRAHIASDTKAANIIHIDILDRILTADFAVCDVSGLNPNVMFELGMRQAFDMPVLILKDERTKNPFDISPVRYVNYSSNLRYDLIEQARLEITASIEATKKDGGKLNSIIQLLSVNRAASLPTSSENAETAGLFLLREKIDALDDRIAKLINSFAPAPGLVLRKGTGASGLAGGNVNLTSFYPETDIATAKQLAEAVAALRSQAKKKP